MFATREMKSEIWIRLAFLMTLVCIAAFAGGKPAAPQSDSDDKLGAIKQSLAQNRGLLKTYTWTETTEITLKGEVKKLEQKQVRYGPDGKVQKTTISGPSSPEQTYLERAAALVDEYVPPDPQKIQASAAAKGMAVQSEEGLVTLTIRDYFKPGDTVALGFDPNVKQLRSYKVNSYVDKPIEDALTLDVTFGSLPDGTNYPQQTVLDVNAKKVRVKITNSEYSKTGL